MRSSGLPAGTFSKMRHPRSGNGRAMPALVATISFTWFLRKARHVGEGGLRRRTMYFSTVDLASWMPKFPSSPTTRGDPQNRLGLDEDQPVTPTRPAAAEPGPEDAIGRPDLRSWGGSLVDRELVSEGEGLPTPYEAPNASPHVERFMRTLRQEALDHFIFLSADHIRRVVSEFVRYYNGARPSQAIHGIPDPCPRPEAEGSTEPLRRRGSNASGCFLATAFSVSYRAR